MPVAKKAFSISPINENKVIQSGVNVITGGFSHKKGNSVVRFSIPTSARLLDVSTLRLTGQLILKTANDNLYNNTRGANINEDNGPNMQRYTSANMPNFGGVSNCIDKVIIQSKKSNVELANVNQYGLYTAVKEANSNSDKDYIWGSLPNTCLSQGYNATHTNRLLNLSANTTQHTLPLGSKYVGQMFSCKLDVDILKSQNLHLGPDHLNGLLITLHLAPDSSVFCQRFKTIAGNQTQANINEVMYVLKNLKLEGKYLIPSPMDLANYPSKAVLNSRLNLVNDIHSSDNTKQYTPQLNNTKSVTNFFLDEDQTNNLSVQQNNCRLPQGIESHEQSKDNVRKPFSFPIKFSPNPSTKLSSGTGGVAVITNLRDKSNVCDSDAESRKHFERSLFSREVVKTVSNLKNIKLIQNSEYEDMTPDVGGNLGKGLNLYPDVRGIGCDYGFGLLNTVAYMNSDYAINVKSLIQTGDVNIPADRNTKSSIIQTFVRNNSVIDLKTLQRSM